MKAKRNDSSGTNILINDDTIVLTDGLTSFIITLFSFYENVVFPAQAEYSYSPVHSRLKIFLSYSYS